MTLAKGAKQPGFGYYAVTDPAKAAALAKRTDAAVRAVRRTPRSATANGIAWGTSPTWAKDATSGDLGASPRVKAALPELAKADMAVYVDLDARHAPQCLSRTPSPVEPAPPSRRSASTRSA